MTLTHRIHPFSQDVDARRAVKAIAGINNFEIERVVQLAQATESVKGVSAIDVAADAAILREVRAVTRKVVFASSVNPEKLLMALEQGADAIELGNYDALYEEGLFMTPEEVLLASKKLTTALNGQGYLSVTVPGHLSTDSQIRLVRSLEDLGVNIIQTEGASRAFSAKPTVHMLTSAEKATVTLSNTKALAEKTALPLMTASGINPENVALAFAAGASAVGVGSAVNKLEALDDMIFVLEELVGNIQIAAQYQSMTKAS